MVRSPSATSPTFGSRSDGAAFMTASFDVMLPMAGFDTTPVSSPGIVLSTDDPLDFLLARYLSLLKILVAFSKRFSVEFETVLINPLIFLPILGDDCPGLPGDEEGVAVLVKDEGIGRGDLNEKAGELDCEEEIGSLFATAGRVGVLGSTLMAGGSGAGIPCGDSRVDDWRVSVRSITVLASLPLPMSSSLSPSSPDQYSSVVPDGRVN